MDIRTAFATYWVPLWMNLNRVRPLGQNIYSLDWDLLVVLDACRVDALQEVADEYNFLPDTIRSMWSVGSTSKEWIEHTFTREYLDEVSETVYITGNPYKEDLRASDGLPLNYNVFNDIPERRRCVLKKIMPQRAVSSREFQRIVDVDGRNYSDEWGFVPPADATTDFGITAGRQLNAKKRIVHYMQPHHPYIAPAMKAGEPLTDIHKTPFSALKRGAAYDAVWDAYIENLRYGLDEVSRLLTNTDADNVVITADHGELFGEWGLYSHHAAIPHPNLRRVPLVETTARDEAGCNPKANLTAKVSQKTSSDLEALGYL